MSPVRRRPRKPAPPERNAQRDQAMAVARAMQQAGSTYEAIAVSLGGMWDKHTIRGWCRVWQRDADSFPDALPNSTILCLHGQKGSGKSLAAAYMAYDYYTQGVPVFYNPKGLLTFPAYPGAICEYASLQDIILRADQLRNCVIVLDEIQVNLSKYRTNTRASSLIRGVIQQVRKLGMDMILTTNDPSALDGALLVQLDFDVKCKSYLPPVDPKDMIVMKWRDTQGAFGRGAGKAFHGREIENRITWAEYIWPASDIYRLFDTTVQVDPLEVMGLTADQIQAMADERDLGVGMGAIEDWLRAVLIPDLVKNRGARSVMAPALAGIIQNSYPVQAGETIHITPVIAAKLCRAIGLGRRGRGSSGGFVLPDVVDLENFKLGLWTAGDSS